MKLHRFIGDFYLKIGNLKLKDEELFNQFRNVLKLKLGETIILGDGQMNEGRAVIKSYGRGFIEVEVKEIESNRNEPERQGLFYFFIF